MLLQLLNLAHHFRLKKKVYYNKKKKLFIGAGVGLLAIVAIVLIVVFATNKDGSDNGGDDPGPDPGPWGWTMDTGTSN